CAGTTTRPRSARPRRPWTTSRPRPPPAPPGTDLVAHSGMLATMDLIPDGFVRALDAFEAVLAAVPADRWQAPSPCAGWAAVDVAGHVTAGLLVVAARAAGRPLPAQDPDWRAVAGGDPPAGRRAGRA